MTKVFLTNAVREQRIINDLRVGRDFAQGSVLQVRLNFFGSLVVGRDLWLKVHGQRRSLHVLGDVDDFLKAENKVSHLSEIHRNSWFLSL